MRRITGFLVRHRIAVWVVALVLLVASLVVSQAVGVNYDLAKYLPDDSSTSQAISVMQENFNYSGSIRVMVEDVSLVQAAQIKERITAIEGVDSVLWLDDLVDIGAPLETYDAGTVEGFYKDSAALYQITLSYSDYDPRSGDVIGEIRALDIDKLSIAGSAEESRSMRSLLSTEIAQIMIIVVPICVLILILASSTWIEPVLYLSVIGISIAFNMGTNIIFEEISFITSAMSAVLQLAIALDYSLFLFHRYLEERDAGVEPLEAVKTATHKSLSSISASALTTVAGFLALVLMQYSIGKDIGLVLAKGIVLSFLCVIVLMPPLIYMLRNVIDKTRHRQLKPPFGLLGRVGAKGRVAILILVVLLVVPAYMAQEQNTYLYGDSSGSAQSGPLTIERNAIEDRFGTYNPIVLLVPSGDLVKEAALADALTELDHVTGVQGLVTLMDRTLPRDMIPQAVRDQFESGGWSRMIVSIDISGETPALFPVTEAILAETEALYPGAWLSAGAPTSYLDIRDSVATDSVQVRWLSILAVGIIVLLTFRSISIPVLLLLVIQSSIWVNMSVPYFQNTPLVYIGYLVISSLQLGATIDYAILIANRYMEHRRGGEVPKDAAVNTMSHAGMSVLVSALILGTAGISEGLISKIPSISAIGYLIGRGALISGALVMLVLPSLLMLFDRLIMKTTWKGVATPTDVATRKGVSK